MNLLFYLILEEEIDELSCLREIIEICSVGVGSFMFEFMVFSCLIGDLRFE